MKEYLMLIRENQEAYEKMTSEEMQQCIELHVKWVEEMTSNGNFKDASPLMPDGKIIKGREKLVTDGPYIEAKEAVSGYYILLAASLEEAAGIASDCPDLDMGASVEIREIMPAE